ncbi:MAG: glutamine synthetase III [Halobacteriovoraceae bacterium]|nr:glutamine synthetase III [Halobacteriovoraceae bacterium]
MKATNPRNVAKVIANGRKPKRIERPVDGEGHYLPVSSYFGENLFDFRTAPSIPESVRKEILSVSKSGNKKISREHAEIVASAVTDWAVSRGATHFCHWFQPLTGSTAEKHDAFLSFAPDGRPIEKLSASQLLQGEPDASSFPNGGSRTTFEARGYTSWDITSPIFLKKSLNAVTLCIPTAFVSYYGDALDIKTPLLRSITKLDKAATEYMNLTGHDTKFVDVTCGCEQEYFLIDKAFFASRSDLVMTGRTLFGQLTSKNQQLSDHYFGAIPERVLAFMCELELEMHRLGIPAKTRHNEVAPGQFEIAPIFTDANRAADQNMITMALIKETAEKHNFHALLHEKPFAGINGSGKHINWSMGTDDGLNLLEPSKEPHQNPRFLTTVSIIIEAVKRHAKAIRMSIASQGNDHRLGANEAPPSIISVFLGETLDKIYRSILEGATYVHNTQNTLDLGATQLAHLLKDNTDRNRTSPFAFTGNKFEVRACGSSAATGFPMSVLNAAVAEVFEESNEIIKSEISAGKSIDEALTSVTKKWLKNSYDVVFNGDGYSKDWLVEAEKRGLPNLRTTPDALKILSDINETKFLTESGIFNQTELTTRHNVLVENYNMLRCIEFETLLNLIRQHIVPSTIHYKTELATAIKGHKEVGIDSAIEFEMIKKLNFTLNSLMTCVNSMENGLKGLTENEEENSFKIANELMPVSEELAKFCNQLEEILPNHLWNLPKYYDMLFIR